MLCTFKRLIYPKTPPAEDSGYRIVLYQPCEKLRDAAGRPVTEVKAVGFFLPTGENLSYDLKGRWARDTKYGVQFEVEGYEEIITPTKEGIVGYLSSGQIKGIGPKTAEKIYQAFGTDTLRILDEEPERLLSIPGISEGKLKKIQESYLANRGARDVVAFLVPHGVTPNRAVKVYQAFGKETMDILRRHPYRLCEVAGIGFLTADQIARSLGLDPRSPERMDAALLHTLQEAEQRGHLCLEKHDLLRQSLKLLRTEGLTEAMAAVRAGRLVEENKLVTYHQWVYRWPTARAEIKLAQWIAALLQRGTLPVEDRLPQKLSAVEKELGMALNDQQRTAVLTAIRSPVTILTGGPGTGKTLTQRALLALYKKLYPKNTAQCCAPTGRAARRMEESTGVEAATIHRALKLMAGEDGVYSEPEPLDADLVLVDEASMLDIYLAENLFRSLKPGCQVVLVGDADQLPSVGPGAVLRELLSCGQIPVVRLTKIYRQNAGSPIAINAALIRAGNLHLEYGQDFEFIESADLECSAGLIEELYLREVGRFGVDNVALLSPFRKKTETGVNALNPRLREWVNPKSPDKPEVSHGKRLFRLGDKVMQTRNVEDVSNGDIGTITAITQEDSDLLVTVDFGDGRVKKYDSSQLELLDLAYATTVHKSQGAEYDSVIVSIQNAHAVMLNRPLLYTAITRAKKRVILVGERKTLCMAIRRTDTEHRNTQLARRILDRLEQLREENQHGNVS